MVSSLYEIWSHKCISIRSFGLYQLSYLTCVAWWTNYVLWMDRLFLLVHLTNCSCLQDHGFFPWFFALWVAVLISSQVFILWVGVFLQDNVPFLDIFFCGWSLNSLLGKWWTTDQLLLTFWAKWTLCGLPIYFYYKLWHTCALLVQGLIHLWRLGGFGSLITDFGSKTCSFLLSFLLSQRVCFVEPCLDFFYGPPIRTLTVFVALYI